MSHKKKQSMVTILVALRNLQAMPRRMRLVQYGHCFTDAGLKFPSKADIEVLCKSLRSSL